MSSRIISFDDLTKQNCPSSIVLDTNFIINLTHTYIKHPASRNTAECNNFIKSLIYDDCQIFIPQIVVNELCHLVYMDALSEYQHKEAVTSDKITLYKKKPNLIAPGHNKTHNAIKALDDMGFNVELKEGGLTVRDRALGLMRQYHHLPSDAYIAAIAIENKIGHIATLDRYFANRISEHYLKVFMPAELIR